jgi:hypothetical protein
MTPQEQQMIEGLIDRVNQTQLPAKDEDAEAMLQQGLGRNPDALYILAQTVLVQKYALDQAQKQIADLKAAKPHTSFLGGLLGMDRPAAPPPPPPPPVYAAPAYGAPMGYGYGAPSGGGFLQTAMQTAAGVVAGEMAFAGIESLMHGFEHHGGYEERGFGDMGGQQGMGSGGGDDYKAFEQPGGTQASDDDSSGQFADTGSQDDSSYDDSGDSGGFGGGDDSGGGDGGF